MDRTKTCPFCGETKSVEIDAMGGEWVSLIINRHGKIYPKVCLNCGIVYISKDILEKIRRQNNE